MKRTLEGTKRKRQRVSGFRARMSTPCGEEVLNRRRRKGRHNLAIQAKKRA
ncbi:MAG: 50S ribosomal protein L34 [Candidatus Gastranaerophilaceae bacterium]|jgi:large subunit ribosomal protein L34